MINSTDTNVNISQADQENIFDTLVKTEDQQKRARVWAFHSLSV